MSDLHLASIYLEPRRPFLTSLLELKLRSELGTGGLALKDKKGAGLLSTVYKHYCHRWQAERVGLTYYDPKMLSG